MTSLQVKLQVSTDQHVRACVIVYIGTITHVQSILCIGIMLNLQDESIGIFMYQNQKGELLTLTCT